MTDALRVRQTVILAAGSGSRLSAHGQGTPKPLTSVAGVPLLAHALAHARASGCEEAIIVVGFDGARVRRAAEAIGSPLRLTFVTNDDHRSPNGVSLQAAEPVAADVFFLQMVDHVFADPVLSSLSAVPLGGQVGGRVLVDSAPPADLDLDDATKVRLAGTRVTHIGKALPGWDAVDAGCFLLTPAVFAALGRVADAAARTVSAGMRLLASEDALEAVDMRGGAWIDVDTPADRSHAERLLANRAVAATRP
jgi:1L-myo-inositol 1-phosphate cytidylyltransferase